MTTADLKSARASLGLSQPQLAAAIGHPVASVRNWEQGRRRIPGSVDVLVKMLLEQSFVKN